MGTRGAAPLAVALLVWVGMLVGVSPSAAAAVERAVTLRAAPVLVSAGDPVVLRGRVTRSPRGTQVRIQERRGSRWVRVTTVRTTADHGAFRATVRPASAGTARYRARVVRKQVGRRTLAAASSPTRVVTVRAREVVRSLTVQLPDALVAHEVVSVPGTLTRTPAGERVYVECALIGSDWERCGEGRTTSRGRFVVRGFQVQEVGSVRVRVSAPRVETPAVTLLPAASPEAMLRVRGADNSGATRLVSVTPEGNFTTDSGSGASAFSADGRHVVFVSRSAELVAGVDPRGTRNVFVRDTVSGTQLVSVTTAGGPIRGVQGDNIDVDVSADGRYVAFSTSASRMEAGDDNGAGDVFVRDMTTGTTTLASAYAPGASGPGDVHDSSFRDVNLSDDGRTVMFTTAAALVPEDSNGAVDVYTRDLDTGSTTLVSRNADGDPLVSTDLSPTGTMRAVLSGDGTYVVFSSDADNIGPAGGPSRQGLYRRNLTTGAVDTIYVEVDAFAPLWLDVSTDGTRVVYTQHEVHLWDADTASSHVVSRVHGDAEQLAFAGVISGDGSTVAFSASAPDAVPCNSYSECADPRWEVYVHDVATATSRAVTRGGGGESWATGLSADGTLLALESDSTWLIPGHDGNGEVDVFLRDLGAS